MPVYSAARELPASRQDVWVFLAEPNHLGDWWPGINGLQPDSRGLAPGARWKIHGRGRPTYIGGRRPRRDDDMSRGEAEPTRGLAVRRDPQRCRSAAETSRSEPGSG